MNEYDKFLLKYANEKGFISVKKLIQDIKEKVIDVCVIDYNVGETVVSGIMEDDISNFVPLIQDKFGNMRLFHKEEKNIWISKTDKGNIVDVYNAQTSSLLDNNGFNYYGYDIFGFNEEGQHKNGTSYDDKGFNAHGYNAHGYHKDGSFDKNKIEIYQKWEGNTEAMRLIQSLNESESITFLTGKAGTGKTTLMKDVIEHFKHKGNPPLVLASTGLASVNIGGQTVHSFFGIPITNPHFEEIKKDIKKDKIKTLADSSFIVIDEISMLSSNILDCVDYKIRGLMADHFGNNALKHKPFGGKKILLVGDLFQLPPIAQPEWKLKFKNIYKSEFFFDAFSIKNTKYEIIELQKNYRQGGDVEFGNILDRVREGVSHQNDINKINTRVFDDLENFGILLTTINKNADSFNATKLGLIENPIYSFNAKVNGIFPNNMKKVPEILELKEGAQIMMLNNDPYKQWVNGDLGIVQGIDQDNSIITVIINNMSFDVGTVVFKNIESRIVDEEIISIDASGKEKKIVRKVLEEEIVGTYEQFPMKLAWAITIHKSQGLTFDKCCIDMGTGAFAKGQAYVALSRCRRLDGIKLKKPFKITDIQTDERVIEFMDKS